jgi:hypothetical protein
MAGVALTTTSSEQASPRLPASLVAFGVLRSVFVLAVTAVFAPWGFYLGGKFHIIPYWQGWGKLQAKSGTYIVFVRFEPTSGGRLSTSVKGVAYLCNSARRATPAKVGRQDATAFKPFN